MALYDELGGEAAIDAALDRFYPKILADPLMSPYFKNVDMVHLKSMAQAFLTMAFGGPNAYTGPGLRAIHAGPRKQGINDESFDRFMFHFGTTLQELGVPADKLAQVAAIAEGARADVLGR
jgi:hemoglobin